MTARLIEIPTCRATDIIAVTLECVELAGQAMWVATIRTSFAQPVIRRWFPLEAEALAHAAERADRHGLPLIDLRGGGEPQ